MTKQDYSLQLAREICQKLIERRLLGASQVAGSLEWLGAGLRAMGENESAKPAMKWAGELTLRLVEQGRARTPQIALDTMGEIVDGLGRITGKLSPEKAPQALRAAVDLALKLLEVHFISQNQLLGTIESLALAAAKVLPEP